MNLNRSRSFLITVARIFCVSAIFIALEARADYDLDYTVSAPGAASSAANPLSIELYVLPQNTIAGPFNVTTITANMTANQKAVQIWSAVKAQFPSLVPSVAPMGAVVTFLGTTGANIVDPTQEPLDKLGFNISVGGSSGFSLSGSATGLTAAGGSSLVQAGIDGVFTATVLPTAGESLSTILQQLQTSLASNGIAATIDRFGELSVVIAPGQTFDYANTDTGLTVSEVTQNAVPAETIPALPGWALTALIALVMATGLFYLRRTEHSAVADNALVSPAA